ncbi:hypothetical protein F5Y18DRAFT_178256 [Xylariaceae sp. FL1019]|nr:hypothetical protein F5Y18DRAFT_178256 [Xylariaceae sp. FL1019]
MNQFLSHHRGKYNTAKLCLRAASLVACLLIIILSAIDQVVDERWVPGDSPDYYFTLPIALFGILIDTVELVLTRKWERNPGAHPGWLLGAEIITFGGNITGLIFLSTSIYYATFYANSLVALRITIVTVLSIYTAIRTALFVFASIDLNRHHINVHVERRIAQVLRLQGQDESAADTYNRFYGKQLPEVPNQASRNVEASSSRETDTQASQVTEPDPKVLGNLSDLQAEELSSGFKMLPSEMALLNERVAPR